MTFCFEYQGVPFYGNLLNMISIVSDTYNISKYILLSINCFYIINGLNITNDFLGVFAVCPFRACASDSQLRLPAMLRLYLHSQGTAPPRDFK